MFYIAFLLLYTSDSSIAEFCAGSQCVSCVFVSGDPPKNSCS